MKTNNRIQSQESQKLKSQASPVSWQPSVWFMDKQTVL